MKLLIGSVCIFSLIIPFSIIERKDFHGGDSGIIQEGHTEEAPDPAMGITANSVDKQTDTMSVGNQSLNEVQDFKTKKITRIDVEATTAKSLPASNTKSVEPRPVTGQKPSQSQKAPAPFAIPVLTQEEAKKRNASAFEYAKRNKDKTILEGQITAISQCPDPGSIDYPDCNLSATVLLNDTAQTTICLIIPCIRNSRIVLSPALQVKQLIAFRIKDEDTLSEEEKSIQLVDDNPNYEIDCCYSDYIEPIEDYSKISKYEKRIPDEIVYDTKIVLTDKDKTIREGYIRSELERLNKIISDYSPEDAQVFHDRFAEYTEDIDIKHPCVEISYDDGTKKVFPVEVNVSVQQYFNGALSNNSDLMIHNANVIASVNEFLKERGITLLVVPVPHPYESFINRLGLSKELSTYNINRILFMRELLRSGVEVLDVEPMIEENIMSTFHYFLLLKKDVHPSEMGAYHFAQYIYDHLKKYECFESLVKNDYSIETKPVKEEVLYNGEKYRDMDSLSIITQLSPINKQSRFLLVGDSFTFTSHIQEYISMFLKTKINTISRGSSFPNTTRLLQTRSNEISANTKICILLNTACHLGHKFVDFYEEGVQIYPNASLQHIDKIQIACKDLIAKQCSFDLNLPGAPAAQNKRKLLVYAKTSDMSLNYDICLDSQQPKSVIWAKDGFSCTDFQLSNNSTQLHIRCSASPKNPESFSAGDDSFFEIIRIVLVEE